LLGDSSQKKDLIKENPYQITEKPENLCEIIDKYFLQNKMNKITFEDFQKLNIKIGKVLVAEKIENSDKLLKLQVDFGVSEDTGKTTILQIVSGIAEFYTPESLIGKEFPFVVNLEPRVLRGVESQGMIMAAKDGDQAVLLSPDKEIPPGSIVK
jgi:methionyl-tRNA synthetase